MRLPMWVVVRASRHATIAEIGLLVHVESMQTRSQALDLIRNDARVSVSLLEGNCTGARTTLASVARFAFGANSACGFDWI